MRLFLKTRWWWQSTSLAVLFEATLPLWARDGLAFNRDGFSETVPLSVIVQFVPVCLMVFSTRAAHRTLEATTSRSLWRARITALMIATIIVTATSTMAALLLGNTGTLQTYSAPVALLGMLGMGLVASRFLDHRIAGVVALIPIIAPMATNPRPLFLSELWSFVAPGDGTGTHVGVALAWFAVGAILIVWRSDRSRLGRIRARSN